jgi:hypothetical protein
MADVGRDEALRTLDEGQHRLDELLSGVAQDDLVHPATIGGGDWSAKDVIGHVAIWEEAAVDAVADIRREEEPRIETYFRKQGGVDRYNAQTMPAIQGLSLDETRARAATAHETLLGEIRGLTDEAWTAPVPYETERRRTLGILLGSITGAPQRPFGHAFAHIPDVEAFVRSLK